MSESPIHSSLVCDSCRQPIIGGQLTEHLGMKYCADCVGQALDKVARRRRLQRDPGWAVVLSLIPGLGQMYSGQMTKGLIILGGFMFAATGSASLGQLQTSVVFTLYFWNLFDAYWTAERFNQAVMPTPPQSLPDVQRWESAAAPAWGVLLVLSGGIFLLNNLGVRWLTFDRAWPATLLGLGIWLLIVFALSRRMDSSVQSVPQETDYDQTT